MKGLLEALRLREQEALMNPRPGEIPVMAGLVLSAGAKTVLHAKSGNPAEAFSLPFQQSAVHIFARAASAIGWDT